MLDIMTKISVEFHIFFPKKYHKLCFLYSFPSKNPPYTFFFQVVTWLILNTTFILIIQRDFFPLLV